MYWPTPFAETSNLYENVEKKSLASLQNEMFVFSSLVALCTVCTQWIIYEFLLSCTSYNCRYARCRFWDSEYNVNWAIFMIVSYSNAVYSFNLNYNLLLKDKKGYFAYFESKDTYDMISIVWHILVIFTKSCRPTWASYRTRKIAGCACAGNVGNVLAIPTCMPARGSSTCRDACRDR